MRKNQWTLWILPRRHLFPRVIHPRTEVRGYRLSMIRKLKSGEYRLYSRKKNPQTGKRRNLGTFTTRAAAEQHEREVQYFKKQ